MKIKLLPLNMTADEFNILYPVGSKFYYFPLVNQPGDGERVVTRSGA
ncbi:hypothetical protein LU631_09810 [Erwinia tracheiphila]|nr:hypothetical protein [Erwinia tracheiphila]UIA82267.1 hypothetical protein LU604_16985 [Erwinia tracheiphila]UIA89453.1 hypothetical protein LU631_09810 [Erwinia tracheiphila]UIA90863.1 hypothetical protein LU632_16570 [Erwinia tracheiphila]UIA97835.1 hypothetical protein LU633_08490 [Erwinia tracheiphila]